MTMPPPPPDRMHLQYQPAPPPPQGPQQMGPAGAYGPAQYAPGQPVPGQMPVGMSPSAMLASGQFAQVKPGTITGIQVILYIFLALSAIGNVFSIMGMVEFFNPFSLIGLGFAVYSAIQSLASGVQISRGKRWAWIWSLVSAILGLALACTGIVYGTIFWDTGGDVMLLITCPLAALYGTLLILLCTKSARQWILMHRIQRGEVQVPGMPMGAMPGMGGTGGTAQAPAAPQRPDTRPAAATFLVAVLGLTVALSAWTVYGSVRSMMMLAGTAAMDFHDPALMYGARIALIAGCVAFLALVGALISALGVHRGKFGARVYTLIWTPLVFLCAALLAFVNLREYLHWADVMPPPARTAWTIDIVLDLALVALIVTAFITVLTPAVKSWTPGKPAVANIVFVPMGQPQAPQQPGPYGGQPQQGYPQQQQQYPPQY
ncbi:hypothetical protein [Glycomyces algeriensis]|uniref:Uncharacterized protein n=1 Tax=Glycomyces algeriensis TaxID=256037 RepID=A0A9W6G885_9ACTN|nr:hypothetical protein [Glycomyces algeriensis]MDA1367946.1 hypothetical protein [Glycomyces algeriensis]MDR7349485.1 hypothetical protein [Glycomyces algeriensis]GLI42190.1 hypothetical protein GALLR39Z86_20400 [Glycomyces algeriensis]